MSLRRTIFWLHLAVGVTGAVAVLVMAATGVLLTYQTQIERWTLRGDRADPAPAAAPLALDALIARIGGEAPAGPVASVALSRDPREPAILGLGDGAAVHVDRFTGERRGDGDTRTARFLRGVMYVHRWLALEGEYRIVGRTIMATANLGFLFLLVSGVWLWWPSRGGLTAWRRALWFRGGLRGRARDFNWHNVIGFWSAVPLAVIAASGATISYQWAADLVHRLAGDTPPFQQSPRASVSMSPAYSAVAPDPAGSPVEPSTVAVASAHPSAASDPSGERQAPANPNSDDSPRVAAPDPTGEMRAPANPNPDDSPRVAAPDPSGATREPTDPNSDESPRAAAPDPPGERRAPAEPNPDESPRAAAPDPSSERQAPAHPNSDGSPRAAAPDPSAPLVALQALAEKAVAGTPGWRTITIDLPESIRAPVVIAVDRGNGRQPALSEDLLFDRATGALVGRGGYPTFSPGFKVRRWLRFAHTGEVYGVIGQSIAGAVSLGAAVMIWTGLAMSWRRFFGPASRG